MKPNVSLHDLFFDSTVLASQLTVPEILAYCVGYWHQVGDRGMQRLDRLSMNADKPTLPDKSAGYDAELAAIV